MLPGELAGMSPPQTAYIQSLFNRAATVNKGSRATTATPVTCHAERDGAPGQRDAGSCALFQEVLLSR
jgi:hypothetical protein